MRNKSSNFFILFTSSIMLALALKIAPWPHALRPFAPDWVLLVLLYWSQILPGRYGILTAWLIGLFTDVLTGRLLGQHALAYSVANYISIRLHKQLHQFEFFRQILFVFFTLTLSHALVTWTQNLHGPVILELTFWYPVFSGILFWPLVFIILHSLCLARKAI